MSIQNQKMLHRTQNLKLGEPDWKSWSPDNAPPYKWEDPTIRFWRDVMKRPLPPTNDDPHMDVKWEPLIRGMYDNAKARHKAAVLLEYQARLLNGMSGSGDDVMTQFSHYLRTHEQEWFRVGGKIQEEFEKALVEKPEEATGIGIFLKFIFPVIRWRCNRDELSEITDEIFDDHRG